MEDLLGRTKSSPFRYESVFGGWLFLQQAEGVFASVGGNERQEIGCGRVGADVEGIDHRV